MSHRPRQCAVARGDSKTQVAASGSTLGGSFTTAGNGTGPYFFCFWAEDAAGNRSVNAPRSSCQWLSVQVPVARVANGCGGAQWGSFWASVQNWFLDSRKYGGYTVYFRMACNLHDAGYSGATVADPFSGKIIDFRTWSRLRVDNKFYDDIGTLCSKYLYNAAARKYLWRCQRGMPMDTVAGVVQPGALAYYQGVRSYAEDAYDADATVPGTQTVVPTGTVPTGGARSNG